MPRLSVALAILLLSAEVVHADDAMPKNVMEAVKAATVFVKVKTEGGSGSGSGFVVKTDADVAYVVTDHHVIEPKLVELLLVPDAPVPSPRRAGRHPRPPRPSTNLLPPGYAPRFIVHSFKDAAVTVVFSSGMPDEQAIAAKVLAVDPERDLALLKVSGVKKTPAPIDYLHVPELTETMPVCTFGFPFGDVLATNKHSPAITVGKASISSLRRDDAGELALVQIDGSLNPGNSGGPMVDVAGRLVGVAVATIRNSSGIGLAIPPQEVARMMQGRLGKVYLHASQDDRGAASVHVEASLIDPFHRIKSATLSYMNAAALSAAPEPRVALGTLSGCRTLPLKIQDQSAVGEIRLAQGVTRVEILCQAVCVNCDGEKSMTNSLTQTVALGAAKVADAADDRPAAGQPDVGGGNGLPAPRRTPPSTARRTRRGRLTEDDLADILSDLATGHADDAMLGLDTIKPQKPHPDVAKALEREMMEDGARNLRAHAARLLKTWGSTQNLPALKKAARDPEYYVRDVARQAIEQISGEKPQIDDLDLLVADLKSSDLGRRMNAMRELQKTKPQEPHPEVNKALETVLLEDGISNMRLDAAITLKLWGTRDDLPALKKALHDRESLVRERAQQAIKAIEADASN